MNIRLRLLTHGNPYLIDGSDNKWKDEFIEQLIEGEEFLREKLILPLNEQIGINNWKLIFIESFDTHDFDVKIFARNKLDANNISETVQKNLPIYKFKFLFNV